MAYNGYDSYLTIQNLTGDFLTAAPASDATDALLYDSFSAGVTFNEIICKPIHNNRLQQDKKYGTQAVELSLEAPVNIAQISTLMVLKNLFVGYNKAAHTGETTVYDYTFYPADFVDDGYLSLESFRTGHLNKYYPAKFNKIDFKTAVNAFLTASMTAIAGQSVAPASTSATPSFAGDCGLSFKNAALSIGGTNYAVTDMSISADMNEEARYAIGSETANSIAPKGIIAPVALTVSLLDYDNTLHTNYLTHADSYFTATFTGVEISGSAVPTNYSLTISIPYIVWDDSKFDISGDAPIKHDLTFKGLYNQDGADDSTKAPILITIVTDIDLV